MGDRSAIKDQLIPDDVPLFRKLPNPMHRQVIGKQFSVGVRAIDATMSLGEGQRIGLMAGSGVSKSTLLGMIAEGPAPMLWF